MDDVRKIAEVTDVVERVARALCRMDCGTDPDAPLTELPDGAQFAWQLYTGEARAALAAMLEAVGEPVKGCENCPILLIKTD